MLIIGALLRILLLIICLPVIFIVFVVHDLYRLFKIFLKGGETPEELSIRLKEEWKGWY